MAQNAIIGGEGLTANPSLVERERNDKLLAEALARAQQEREFQARYQMEQQQMAQQAQENAMRMQMAQAERADQAAREQAAMNWEREKFGQMQKSALEQALLEREANKEALGFDREYKMAQLNQNAQNREWKPSSLEEALSFERGKKGGLTGGSFLKAQEYGAPEGLKVKGYDEFGQPTGFEEKGMNLTKDQMQMAMSLQKEYNDLSKDFIKVKDSVTRVKQSAQNPTPANDIALIFNYMKTLDPGSVVREGEFATAQNATGVPQQVANLYNKVIRGTRLNPQQRADFVSAADTVYQGQLKNQLDFTKQYTEQASRWGIDPKDVVGSTLSEALSSSQNKTSFASVAEAESANLPKGTVITINGRRAVVE